MQNFREAVIQALQEPALAEPSETPWEQVLREFASSINEGQPLVFAFVRPGSVPTVRHFLLGPKGRRDRAEIQLSLQLLPSAVIILSGDHREFTQVDEFQRFLVGFTRLPDFRESVRVFSNIANEPVPGLLRSGPPQDRSPAQDILVSVPPEEQHRLAAAAEAAEPASQGFHVDPIGPSPLGAGQYDPAVSQPRWLVAGGYALSIARHGLDTRRILLVGVPQVLETLS